MELTAPETDDDTSLFSLALALITLSPILLMASYAALAVQTREFLIITMWIGQVACELLNWVIKRIIKEERPIGNGYGFPSSHSQYMAYFATFLICHLYVRHRFSSAGYPLLDGLWRVVVYTGVLAWAGLVAYSRYYLGYHNARQIIWGLSIGSFLGLALYVVSELVPRCWPSSYLGRTKIWLLSNPVSTWLEIRDGWAVWPDAGRESEWVRWRKRWEEERRGREAKRTQ
ncbi:uncharacterized protein LACBIDRAFT_317313 [Laccaria bicolor S238N-H82]|uniref:Predicted protein n=1 Tax=Laccaria bicolor (strain S238N-H82 / ATCC MYA-4686) TaxID=486041 RepID=B0D4W2_LACBS|nr:uncharacterized protein LACBIDRAFT_317313 [Laccaria bicolor S238N-H82]EDR10632.1 predicted protein [Laccaria bicolor S238N-H82]|eukprot:XP_001879082.1 predicted protein [Laccaria bicolor S238N-H82]